MPHEIRNWESPYTAESFWEHYGGQETTVCLFGKLTPVAFWGGAAEAIGFTSNTRDVYLANHSLTFKSAPGVNPTVVEMTIGTEASNVENLLQFDDDAITEEDLEAGKWNYAHLELWLMNYEALEMGEFVVYSGRLGELRNMQTFFKAEAEGGHSLLQNNYGWVTSRICRVNEFGDELCKYNSTTTPDGFSVHKTLTVSSVDSKYALHFTRSAEDVPDDFYNHGKVTGLVGANAGISREIKYGTGEGTGFVDVALCRSFPFPITAGNTFILEVGCDRTLERCMYFDNVINRRAEDYIPGLEAANRFPPAT